MPRCSNNRNIDASTADAVETALNLSKGDQTITWATLSRSAERIKRWSSAGKKDTKTAPKPHPQNREF